MRGAMGRHELFAVCLTLVDATCGSYHFHSVYINKHAAASLRDILIHFYFINKIFLYSIKLHTYSTSTL